MQTVFLGQIRKRLPEKTALADELAELLNISRDSAYRRIRGETILSLDEVKKLYDRYGVSLDAIITPDSNMVLFKHQEVDLHYSLEAWMKALIQNLELAKSSPSLELIFASKDIPIFYYFNFPDLCAFKLFVWSKSIIRDQKYENLQFGPDVIPKEIMAYATKAYQLYSSIPSTEVWSDEAIVGPLKQLEYYYDSGFLASKEQAFLLYDQLVEFQYQIREQAANGRKNAGGSFTLYHNEVLILDNTIFAKINDERVVYINYNTLDLLITQQDPFCEKTEIYMNNLIKSSALISATAERERNRFFNMMEEQILASKAKLG